LNDADDL
jgi:serine/threonine protein kinase